MKVIKFLSKLIRRQSTRRKNEQSARMRLELALEASGLVDWDFDYEQNTAYRGLRHDQLYGYESMLPQWNFDHFYHHVLPEFHELAKMKFDQVALTGKIAFEYKIRKVNGELRWISLVGQGQRNSRGKIVRVAGVLKDITAEKNFEEKMILQTKNMFSLFEKSPEFFCIIRASDLVYEYVNPAHVLLFQGKDLTGLSIDGAQPELKNSALMKALKNIQRTGETVIYKNTPAHIGDRLRYLDMIYAPRRNAKNEVDGIYALGSDVTDKIMALNQAEKSEAHMRLITNKLPAFISYTDSQGRYQFMNTMYEKWFDRPISEMLGKTRDELTPVEYAIQSKPFESKAMLGSVSHHEGIIRKANGDFLNLDINFVSDIDPETKEVRGMIAVGVDITTRMEALKDAELARKELHEVFMQAPAPMCLLTGPDHLFTMANPLYVQFVRREVLGKKLTEVFAGEDIAYYQQIVEHVYKTGKPFVVTQAPIDLNDEQGHLIRSYINVGYHAYKDAEDKVKGVLVIIQDVTDQVSSVKARDSFIGIASHELKTPITAMKLQMQMNLKNLEQDGTGAFSSERLNKIFNNSISQVNRLSRLVDDMLDGSRVSAEQLSMSFHEADFSKLVMETFESFAPQFKSVGMELNFDVQDNIYLKLDEDRMEQVLTNLITNAIRYAPHAPLSVQLYRAQDEVILKVKDQGMGIDSKYHDRIFERFERVDTGRDFSGLGLGLYISKKIVQNHGGRIIVISGPGKGSEFSISLPVS